MTNVSVQLQSNEDHHPLESPEALRKRKISHYVVYFTITSSSLYYSVLLVSLWPYLNNLDPNADKHFLGYLAAIGAVGTTLFCPLIGKWSNSLKSCRVPFLFTLFCGALHYVIYVFMPLSPVDHRRYWFLLARLMIGMHDINIGLSRGYIAESTLKEERRQAISIITGCQTIAFALGPALQSLLVPLQEKGYSVLGGYVKFDMYTSIGWMGLITILINVALFLPAVFHHSDMRHAEKFSSITTDLNRNYKLVACIFTLLQFWLVCSYLFLKVLGTPLVMDEFAMNRPDALQYNSYIVTVGAGVSLVAILSLDIGCKKFGEMNIMYTGFLIMILGRFVMYPIVEDRLAIALNQTDNGCPQWSQQWCCEEKQMFKSQFITSNVLDNFGYSWAITIIYTKFSQILGAKQQGTWMGFMTALSGLARIVSPIVFSHLYASLGNAFTVLVTNIVYIGLIVATLWAIDYWTRKGSTLINENILDNHENCELMEQNAKKCVN